MQESKHKGGKGDNKDDGSGLTWTQEEVRAAKSMVIQVSMCCVSAALKRWHPVYILQCLAFDPAARPTVAQLLDTDFLRETDKEREKRLKEAAEKEVCKVHLITVCVTGRSISSLQAKEREAAARKENEARERAAERVRYCDDLLC